MGTRPLSAAVQGNEAHLLVSFPSSHNEMIHRVANNVPAVIPVLSLHCFVHVSLT